MTIKDLRSKSNEELQAELLGLLKAQFALRMQISTQQSNKTSELRRIRRDIARVRTLMHEKKAA